MLGRFLRPIVLFVLMLVLTGISKAVVVSTSTETDTRPTDDRGWDNVGILRGSSGVYLGNRWVITAAHVGSRDVEFPGIGVFEFEPGSAIQLKNPVDRELSEFADILLYRLKDDPQLPPIQIATTAPEVGEEVTLIGNGRTRLDELTFWHVRGAVWTESTDENSRYQGFRTTGDTAIRWGTNLIESDQLYETRFDGDNNAVISNANEIDTLTLITEFDRDGTVASSRVKTEDGNSATELEAHAVSRDSGGGVFSLVDGEWMLGGIINSVVGHTAQPNPIVNAVFGNMTFSADLTIYRDEITSHYVFGDVNDDQLISVEDIDQLSQQIREGSSSLSFDFNRDGVLDQGDRRYWVEDVNQTEFGDANLDGQFGTRDLVLVFTAAEYEDGVVGNSTWSTGDWNGDGDFSSNDLVLALQSGRFEDGSLLDLNNAHPVPEANPFRFLMVLLSLFILRQRRRQGC